MVDNIANTLESPHFNGGHTLANRPDFTLKQLQEIHLKICEKEGIDAEGATFLQATQEVDPRELTPGFGEMLLITRSMPRDSEGVSFL